MSKSKQRRARKTKRERDLKYKRHLEKLADIYGGRLIGPVFFKDWKYDPEKGFIDLEEARPVRIYYGNKYYKRMANKAVRHNKDILKRAYYKKIYEYEWNIS